MGPHGNRARIKVLLKLNLIRTYKDRNNLRWCQHLIPCAMSKVESDLLCFGFLIILVIMRLLAYIEKATPLYFLELVVFTIQYSWKYLHYTNRFPGEWLFLTLMDQWLATLQQIMVIIIQEILIFRCSRLLVTSIRVECRKQFNLSPQIWRINTNLQ